MKLSCLWPKSIPMTTLSSLALSIQFQAPTGDVSSKLLDWLKGFRLNKRSMKKLNNC